MNDQFPLPPECLWLILKHLATITTLPTLAALLRTSRYLCLSTLPFLYADPFSFVAPRLPLQINGVSRHYDISCLYPRLHAIIRTLLTSVSGDQCPGLVKAMYGTEAVPPQCWPINYLSYLQNFQSQTNRAGSHFVDLNHGLPLPPTLKQYIGDHDLTAHYESRAPMVDWENEEDTLDGTGLNLGKNILGHLNVDIHRELTWTLCNPVLEQLKSIVIPLSDIDRYQDAVPRMSSLVSATFKLDEVADVDPWWAEELGEEVMTKVALVQSKRLQDLESAVEFVRFHTLLYPGQLAHVACPDDFANVGFVGKKCPPSVSHRMLGTPLARGKPTEVNNENWKQFLAKMKETDLSRLTLIHVHGPDTEWYYQLKSTPFLHRCTALEAYYMMSLGPDSFKWAVKKDGIVLPPLKAVKIQALKEPFGSEVDDLELGFGTTLEVLRATGHSAQNVVVDHDNIPTVAIGRGWEMPVLMQLTLVMVSERLLIDSGLLIHCPALQRLELRDSIGSYDVRGIQSYQPSSLPELTKLFLSGTPALSFHPDTLYSTVALKTLVLGSPGSIAQDFLPSVYDFLNVDLNLGTDEVPSKHVPRSRWAWNWFLPQLETLDLSVEFSVHFQFCMLQGTPGLQELHLTILSTHAPVDRVLTESDFTVVPLLVDETGALLEDSSKRLEGGASLPLPVVPSLSMLPHKELHALYWHMSGLHLSMERSLQEPDQQQQDVDVSDPAPLAPPLLDEAHLLQQRQERLTRRQEYQTGMFSPGSYSPQQLYDVHLNIVQSMVQAKSVLQQELESLLAAREKYYLKKDKEAARAVERQTAQPNRLIVSSLRTLELNGAWNISEHVLDIMVGHVFANLESVDLFGCVGFSTETWISATAGMPFLKTATLSRVLEVEKAAAYGLTLGVANGPRSELLFETDTRRRLGHIFLDGEYVFAA